MSYDLDNLVADLDTFIKANLNTKIGEINTEKNDSLTLDTVNDSGIFFQTMNDTVANWNPFLFYGVKDIENEGIGPATSKRVFITAIIAVVDTGQDLLIGRRMLRYGRVLEELFEDDWNSIGNHSLKFKVQSLVPVSFTLLNSSETHRAVGVDLETSLG